MPDSLSSAMAPTVHGTAASKEQTYQTIPKPKNIKKCKLEETMDFGPGKTFPHNMFLDIQAKIQNNMLNMLDNVAIPWEEVPKGMESTVLTLVLASYPVLHWFPGNWVAKVIMRRICCNKRNTQANKQKRLRGVKAKDANTTPPKVLKEGLAEEWEANHLEDQLVEEDQPDREDWPIEEDQPNGEDQPNHPPVDKQLLNNASKDNEDEEGAEIKRMARKRCCCIEDSNSEEDNQHVHLLSSQTPLALCASSAIPTSSYKSSLFTISIIFVIQARQGYCWEPTHCSQIYGLYKPSAQPPKGPTPPPPPPTSKPTTSKPTTASKGTKPAFTQAAAVARPQGHKPKKNTKPKPKPEYGPKSKPEQGQEFKPESKLDEAKQDIPPQNNKRPIPKERYAHLTVYYNLLIK
ncbi:hypothetical protein RHS01_11220 [Rhizoctonia solani]|uniref:Uncharacterized protein n=1 Tax=Rhizoctonia solani TaxID=456999 RepID=A0A8H7LWJ0_9AGAM|nr:hypothetical protein RHS01_11220 [Rhizoctonia solani]